MSRHQNIKELFNEFSCSHAGDKDKKTTCERLVPGTIIGGCSFEGAFQTLAHFKGAAHILHSPSTCPHTSQNSHDKEAPLLFSTTQMTLHDLIFGAEGKLGASIEYVYTHYQPKVIFVYLTCVGSLIGEDVESITIAKEKALGIPIVLVDAAGFLGGIPFGARVAGITLMEYFMGQKEPVECGEYDINLISYNTCKNEMAEYQSILEAIGFKIRWVFGAPEEIETTFSAHRAKLNVVIGSKSMVALARKMEERWDIPWVEVSFNGKHATSDAIRAIVEVFADGLLTRVSERYIAKEEKTLTEALSSYKACLKDKVAVIKLHGKDSWQFIALLKELGMRIAATSIQQSTQDDIEKVYTSLAGEGMVLRNCEEDLVETIEEENVDILLCYRHDFNAAVESKIAFMEINTKDVKHYAGYNGLVAFAQEMVKTLTNPFFKVVYAKAPWQ